LLEEHQFDLVRQRKHKIYRNPDGLTFVLASTPSDWRSSRNALATLKRILRPISDSDSRIVAESENLLPVVELAAKATPTPIEMPEESISEQEWDLWKQQYWHEEGLRKKNDEFLSLVTRYVDRLSDLLVRGEILPGTAAEVLKILLRRRQYKSKLLIYNCKFFEKGAVTYEAIDQPIVWASNGHVGISSFLYFGSFIQHQASRLPPLRFIWEGFPVLFERPEPGQRRFPIRIGKSLGLSDPS